MSGGAPIATYVLIGLNAIVFLAEMFGGGGGSGTVEAGRHLIGDGGLCGNAIADGGFCGVEPQEGGEPFRIITGAFLHAGPLHLLLNMFALYVLGTLIEPAIGTLRFVAIYFAALLAGSFGALLATDPNEVTVGASGAIFGLMGAAFVIARYRGMQEIQSADRPLRRPQPRLHLRRARHLDRRPHRRPDRRRARGAAGRADRQARQGRRTGSCSRPPPCS